MVEFGFLQTLKPSSVGLSCRFLDIVNLWNACILSPDGNFSMISH